MIDACRGRLSIFNGDYVWEATGEVEIVETAQGGEGRAIFQVQSPAIIMRTHRRPPLVWGLKNPKCADGAFITFSEHGAHLHIVELKSRLTLGEWKNVILQLHGMYLAAVAAAHLCSISAFETVTCYVAFREDATAPMGSATPILLKTAVGMSKPLGGGQEWSVGEMEMPFGAMASIAKAQRDADGDADFGAVN